MSVSSVESNPGKYVVQISSQILLCKSECGFYANAQWDGFCSKCHRERGAVVKRQEDYTKNRFDDFEQKKKEHDGRKTATLRSILRISPTRGGDRDRSSQASTSSSTPPSHKSRQSAMTPRQLQSPPQRSLTPESQVARQKFLAFLNELPRSLASEISGVATAAAERILQHAYTMGTDELAQHMQDVYDELRRRLAKHSYWLPKKTPRHTIDECVEHLEEYICVRCYDLLFCADNDEEAQDLSLQHRIRSLHWVTGGFLEHGLDFTNNAVRDAMDNAFAELIDVNARRTVNDKLACLVACSKQIFEALKISRNGAPASADDFLPVLIYSILRANPPQLQSNVKFVSRFALPYKVETGETGYFFTHLSCAMIFVQNMNAASLQMPKDEFEAYTSGRMIAPRNETNYTCHQMVKTFEKTLEGIAAVRERQTELAKDIDVFKAKDKQDMDELLAEMVQFNVDNPAVDPGDFPRVKRVTMDDVRRAQKERLAATGGTMTEGEKEVEGKHDNPELAPAVINTESQPS